MPLFLGIDTGGTCTDGVLIDPTTGNIISTAKTATTKTDLTIGIAACIDALKISEPAQVSLVSLSTTLATNAVVEGRGGNVGLVAIGKMPEGRLPAHTCHCIPGMLDIKGNVKEALKTEDITETAKKLLEENIDAVAISGYASVRNPSHEIAVDAAIVHGLIQTIRFKCKVVHSYFFIACINEQFPTPFVLVLLFLRTWKVRVFKSPLSVSF